MACFLQNEGGAVQRGYTVLAGIRSILFIELLGGLGDLLMALPAIRALTHTYPEAALHVLTFPPSGELIESEPSIDRVHYAARGRAPEMVKNVLGSHRYDLVISDTCYEGIDFLVEGYGSGYGMANIWQSARSDELVENLFLRNLAAAGIIDERNNQYEPLLTVPEADAAWATMWRERNLSQPEKMVLLNPHAGMPIKRWHADNFVTLGRALSEEGVELVVVSGEDPSLARHIARQIGSAATLLPKTTLRQLAALAATADLCLSVDTGPGRISASVSTPAMMLFGPTWSGRYGLPPPNVNLQSPFVCPHLNPMNFTEQPCWYSGICVFPEKRNCVDDIAPESVLTATKRILGS